MGADQYVPLDETAERGHAGAVRFVVTAVMLCAIGCAPGSGPNGDDCRARCISDEPGLAPNRIQCVGDDGLVCAPVMGCLDATPILISICTSDGPRCRDGSEPRCVPSTPPDGG
jgi:hypothetical protein